MMEGVVPYCCVKVADRSESVGNAAEAPMLWGKPSVCPTSCAMIYSSVEAIKLSGMVAARAAGSRCAVCTKRQLLMVFTTSL